MSMANKTRSRMGRPGLPGRVGRFAAGVVRGARSAGGGRMRKRRRRGITATELRGFRKVARLLKSVGLAPRLPARRRTK